MPHLPLLAEGAGEVVGWGAGGVFSVVTGLFIWIITKRQPAQEEERKTERQNELAIFTTSIERVNASSDKARDDFKTILREEAAECRAERRETDARLDKLVN